ncbi:hypothetical protein MKEN_01350200 [Mycena kentingensis (nom. inval.)]|nr:hypothetical protein MKEN_01350200 [Mycena kentingensis (nom. inval.)]
MESYKLAHLPSHLSHIHAALYVDVSDAAALKRRLIAAAAAEGDEGEQERAALNFAFIDARLITSLALLKAAIYSAVLSEAQGRLLTKTVHSEIIWTLNPTNNISEAMRRYGVSETSTSLVAVRVAGPELPPAAIQRAMSAAIRGTPVPFTDLAKQTDWAAVKKYHKLANDTAIRDAKDNIDMEHAIIDEIVVSCAAIKCVQA